MRSRLTWPMAIVTSSTCGRNSDADNGLSEKAFKGKWFTFSEMSLKSTLNKMFI